MLLSFLHPVQYSGHSFLPMDLKLYWICWLQRNPGVPIWVVPWNGILRSIPGIAPVTVPGLQETAVCRIIPQPGIWKKASASIVFTKHIKKPPTFRLGVLFYGGEGEWIWRGRPLRSRGKKYAGGMFFRPGENPCTSDCILQECWRMCIIYWRNLY